MASTYNEQFPKRDVALKVQLLQDEMKKIEEEYRKKDPTFSISHMYNYIVIDQKILFCIHVHADKEELGSKIKKAASTILY